MQEGPRIKEEPGKRQNYSKVMTKPGKPNRQGEIGTAAEVEEADVKIPEHEAGDEVRATEEEVEKEQKTKGETQLLPWIERFSMQKEPTTPTPTLISEK